MIFYFPKNIYIFVLLLTLELMFLVMKQNFPFLLLHQRENIHWRGFVWLAAMPIGCQVPFIDQTKWCWERWKCSLKGWTILSTIYLLVLILMPIPAPIIGSLWIERFYHRIHYRFQAEIQTEEKIYIKNWPGTIPAEDAIVIWPWEKSLLVRENFHK